MVTRLPADFLELDKITENITWLNIAESGAGKTAFAATLPRPFFFATEPGTVSAANMKIRPPGGRAKRIRSWDDMVTTYEWFRDHPDAPFDWLVIDSAPRMQELHMKAILDYHHKQNPRKFDPHIPQIQMYLKEHYEFKQYVLDINELPFNIMWTALPLHVEDSEGDPLVLPMFQGKDYAMAEWVCAQMHLVTQLVVRKTGKGDSARVYRRLITDKSPPFFAKDRYNCLGPYININSSIKPSATDIVKKIEAVGQPPRPSGRTAATRPTRSPAATRRRRAS